jgi:capsular polysaccharide biosynthesis protein
MPKTYQAGAVISPLSENSGGQLSGIGSSLGQLAGLASLAGISTGADSKKAESLAVLQSEALTEKYIRDNDLLPILFQDKWDSSTAKWKVSDPGKVPTVWKGNEFFRDHVRLVVTSPKTSIVTLSISWRDPYLAAKWANDLVDVANDYLRLNAIKQSERNIAYLTEQASKTDAVGVKQAIYQILQAEINKAMLARGSEEYAFRVLDRAVPPERPSSPRKSLWLLGGLVAGFGISTLIVLIRVTRLS